MRSIQRNTLLVCAVVAMALLGPLAVTPADAAVTDGLAMVGRDPEQIAAACIRRTHAMAVAGAERNIAIARECVPRIEELVEAGRVEEARALAARCVHHIQANSRHTGRRIVHGCQHCIRVLIRLEEPELARAVYGACQRGLNGLQAAREAAIAAIRNALP